MNQKIQLTAAVALACACGAASAQSYQVQVDAKSNLFYAGTTLTPPTANCQTNVGGTGLGDGLYPPHITLPAGLRAIQLTTSNDGASYGGSFPAGSTPDGHSNVGSAAASTATLSTNSSGTMNGLELVGRYGTLAAVVLDGSVLTAAHSPANTGVNTFTPATLNAPVIGGTLRSPFFVGDGTTVDWVTTAGTPNGTEQRQTISIPSGGTRLFFGFADAGAVSGVNGCYMDNNGSIRVSLAMGVSDDEGTVQAGTAAAAIANVRANDYLMGAAPTAPRATITPKGAWPAGITLDTTSGAVNVAATVAAGDYPAEYTLCDTATTPASCSDANVLVHVTAAAATALNGVADSGSTTTAGGTAIANVRSNDTVAGAPATAANSTIAVEGLWPTGLSLNTTTGAISVAAGTPVATYTLAYKLCEAAVSTNCTTVNAYVSVSAVGAAPIVAGNNAYSVTNTFTGVAGNVLDNDTVNGVAANGTNATVTPLGTWPAGASLDASGDVIITAGLAAGTYTVSYQLCQAGATPANCVTAQVTITRAAMAAAPVPTTSAVTLGLMSLALLGAGALRRKRH